MEKHDIVEGVINTYEFPNKGSFHMDDRKVTVKGAIKGQKVSCRITKPKKGKADGRLLESLRNRSLRMLHRFVRILVCAVVAATRRSAMRIS